jgi:hypothetical protein
MGSSVVIPNSISERTDPSYARNGTPFDFTALSFFLSVSSPTVLQLFPSQQRLQAVLFDLNCPKQSNLVRDMFTCTFQSGLREEEEGEKGLKMAGRARTFLG